MSLREIYENTTGKANKIACLKGYLSSPESPVGDWKVIKIYEARMNGEEDPYDFDELAANRKLVREEINRLQALPDEEDVTLTAGYGEITGD